MEKTKQLISLIGLVLMMTTCMSETTHQGGMNNLSKHLTEKLEGTDCVNTTVYNHACHAARCHNVITYIRGCETYNGDQCDNLTAHFDVYNSTGWRNTTCFLRGCYDFDSDDCGNANFTFQTCTNGDCRNGTTYIHACFSTSYAMKPIRGASVLSGLGVEENLNDYFDTPCLNFLFYTTRRTDHSIES